MSKIERSSVTIKGIRGGQVADVAPDGLAVAPASAARVTDRRQRLLYVGLFFGVQIARTALTVVAAKLLPREDVGLWNLLVIVPWYLQFAQLGVVNAMNRELPIARGQGNLEHAERIASLALWWTVVPPLAIALPAALIAMLAMSTVSPWLLTGAVLYTAALHLQTYQLIHSIGWGDMWRAIRQQVVYLAALCLATAALVLYPSLSTLVWGFALSFCVAALSANRLPRFPRDWRRTIARSNGLIRMGFPVMLVGVLQLLLLSLDRWAIRFGIGLDAVGAYTPAVLALTALQLLPQAGSTLYYARMAEAFGRHGEGSALFSLARRQTSVTVAASTVAVLGIVAALFTLVPRYLPLYAAGILPGALLAVGGMGLSLSSGGANYLNVTRRTNTYLKVQVAALLVAALLLPAAAFGTKRLDVVAGASAAVLLGYGLTIHLIAAGLARRSMPEGAR